LQKKTRLKVVIVTDTYAKEMGYAGSRIPAAMAKHGDIDVHLVTAGLPAYYQITDYDKTYSGFQKPDFSPGDVRDVEGFTVHYIGYKFAYGGVRLQKLKEKLREIKPDIVQVFTHTGWASIDVARFQPALGYKLFTGNHSGKIVYAPARMALKPWSWIRIKEFLRRGLPGRFISSRTVLCYGASDDATEVATGFFGLPISKAKTLSLGVDTAVFHPSADQAERDAARDLRKKLGVLDEEILCLYTGKLTEEKRVLLFAQAVADLRAEGHSYRAVVFGAGPQADSIVGIEGAIVHPFVHFRELGSVYRAADIAVWPAEITTSTLDAAACGIPIIVNDQILASERYEGNGLTYRLNDLDDLKRALLELKDPALRKKLGDEGARKMRESYSWDALVQVRLDDYREALGWDQERDRSCLAIIPELL
jgi:glycosyltransferase involved in cell wall biosynthesis